MGVLTYTFGDLYKEAVSKELFATATPAGDQITDSKRIANEAAAEFYSAHPWSFLKPQATITLWTTATGTMTVTNNTTVTAAAAAFYPSMIGATLVADTSEKEYTISAYTSATVVTVATDASGDTGDTFTITPNGAYALPSDYGGLIDEFSYVAEQGFAPLHMVSVNEVRYRWGIDIDPSGEPTIASIQPKAFVAATGQRWELIVWRVPSTTRVMKYRYRVDPNEMTSDSEYPLGGAVHGPAIRAACLMMAETSGSHPTRDGPYAQRYDRMLATSIRHDGNEQARNLGQNADHSDDIGTNFVRRMGIWSYTQS